MGHHHHHHPNSQSNIKVAFWINSGFALLELVGGFYTNSIAIMTDALHDFGDSLSLGLSYYFEKKSNQKRDKNYSYGYKRFSLLGAIINAFVLTIGSILIIKESVMRIVNPQDADAKGMLILAIIGVVVNFVAMLRLKKGSSINERVISLHFLEDVLGWAAVLVGSIVMMFTHIPVLDPILSLGISGFILFNVFRNMKEAIPILLQSTPEDVDMKMIKERVQHVPGVLEAHDLHTWTMDGHYNILTIHIVVDENLNQEEVISIKNRVRNQLKDLAVHHATIETERKGDPCVLREC